MPVISSHSIVEFVYTRNLHSARVFKQNAYLENHPWFTLTPAIWEERGVRGIQSHADSPVSMAVSMEAKVWLRNSSLIFDKCPTSTEGWLK